MKTIAKLTLAACALIASSALVAQTYKCRDANGKITYSGKICSDLGLKDAGEVKEQINTAPAYKPPPGSRTSPAPATQAPAAEPPPAAEPEAPRRRCFTVQTAKGTATRCNDAPPDPDAPPDKP
jgi:hypothetical protein